MAVKRANKIGGKRFHNKQFGGGIVFQSYNIRETERSIKELIKAWKPCVLVSASGSVNLKTITKMKTWMSIAINQNGDKYYHYPKAKDFSDAWNKSKNHFEKRSDYFNTWQIISSELFNIKIHARD